MTPTLCRHCGAADHAPYEEGLIECRDRLVAEVARVRAAIREAADYERTWGYSASAERFLERAMGANSAPAADAPWGIEGYRSAIRSMRDGMRSLTAERDKYHAQAQDLEKELTIVRRTTSAKDGKP